MTNPLAPFPCAGKSGSAALPFQVLLRTAVGPQPEQSLWLAIKSPPPTRCARRQQQGGSQNTAKESLSTHSTEEGTHAMHTLNYKFFI